MSKLAEFRPIVVNKKEEMLSYYKDNNIPIPDVPYFREAYDIKPEEVISEEVKEVPSVTSKKPIYTPKVDLPGVSKAPNIPERFKNSVDQKSNFVNKFWDAAHKASKKVGVPAETLLAMSAVETGWGKSMPGNMVAGIKADKGYTGKVQEQDTTEYIKGKKVNIKDKFRAYDTPEEAFEDFGNFLKQQPRYSKALGEKDPYKAAKIIAGAGYATSPDYYNLVSSIIKDITT